MHSLRKAGLCRFLIAFFLCTNLVHAVFIGSTCSSINTQLANAIQEAINFAQNAQSILQNALDDESRPIGQKQLSATAEILVTKLFAEFFGNRISQDANGNPQDQNQEARAKSVLGMT
jgi:hypothetical protein